MKNFIFYALCIVASVTIVAQGLPKDPISPTRMSGTWKFFRSDGCVPAIDCDTKLMTMDTVIFDTRRFTRENEYFARHVEDGRAVFVSPLHVFCSKMINEIKKK